MKKTMTEVQMEEAIYFYLKYTSLMNKIRVLMKDALVLREHIKFIEGGDIHDNFFEGDESCRN